MDQLSIRSIYFDCGSLEEWAKSPQQVTELILRHRLSVQLSNEVFSETCNITNDPSKRPLFVAMMEVLRGVLPQVQILPHQLVALRIQHGILVTLDIVKFWMPQDAIANAPPPQVVAYLWQEGIKSIIRNPDDLPAEVIAASYTGAMQARKWALDTDASFVWKGTVLPSPKELMENPDVARRQIELHRALLANYGITQHRDSLPQLAMFSALFLRDWCITHLASKEVTGQLSRTKARKARLPGAMDVAQMVYLPFVDAFVTDDDPLKKFAREVARYMGHRCWIGTFEKFEKALRNGQSTAGTDGVRPSDPPLG